MHGHTQTACGILFKGQCCCVGGMRFISEYYPLSSQCTVTEGVCVVGEGKVYNGTLLINLPSSETKG